MFSFTYRNLMLLFRDRAAVLLSFLSDAIIITLYFLFLRDNLLSYFTALPQAELLIDLWMMAGLLGTTSFSVSMSTYSIYIDDRENRIYKDLFIIPRSRMAYLGGYWMSASLFSFLLSFILFLFCELYFWSRYHVIPGSDCVLTVYILLCLISAAGAALALFLVSFIKTSHTLSSCCTIFGALIGFLTGIYLPIGSIPDLPQKVIQLFPISHGVLLFREALMYKHIINTFGETTRPEVQDFLNYMGVQFLYQNQIIPEKYSVTVLLTITLTSLLLSFIVDSHIINS